jgi:hypothetical protein
LPFVPNTCPTQKIPGMNNYLQGLELITMFCPYEL